MKVTPWGTRGSLASPGPETSRYGGNTSCLEVRGTEGTLIVLDAGTGILRLSAGLPKTLSRVDVLLTHMHMDHIQGLGFFSAIYDPDAEVHIWGPGSTTLDLRGRLMRFLSPPLFPVHLRELPCKLELHEVPCEEFQIGEFTIRASLVCHPGPTVGYRISSRDATIAYLPDHEPALGARGRLSDGVWTSGYDLAAEADLLIHDSQYTDEEYAQRVGWGHSTLSHALNFAALTGVARFMPFHYDPGHSDDQLDRIFAAVPVQSQFDLTPAQEGVSAILPGN